ncbi:MAG: response regulator [Candidatus Hydrogenedentota bacterium]
MTQAIVATTDGELGAVLVAELEGEGFDVTWASNGAEAVELASQGASILFLGVDLPVFDGLEVAAQLRADPDIPREFPIVLLAARDIEPHAIDAAGVNAVLPDAHTAQDVRELVSRHLYPS